MKNFLLFTITASFLSCYSVSAADQAALEKDIAESERNAEVTDSYIMSLALAAEVIEYSQDVIETLKKDQEYIERIQDDPDFLACVSLYAEIKGQKHFLERAKHLRKTGKLTEVQLNSFKRRMGEERELMLSKYAKKQCVVEEL